MKRLEVGIFSTEPVDTAEVRGTVLVSLAVGHLLLLDTDPSQHLPPGLVTVTPPVPSVPSLSLGQGPAVRGLLAGPEGSLVVVPGEAHVHEAAVLQARAGGDVVTVLVLSTDGIERNIPEDSEFIFRAVVPVCVIVPGPDRLN